MRGAAVAAHRDAEASAVPPLVLSVRNSAVGAGCLSQGCGDLRAGASGQVASSVITPRNDSKRYAFAQPFIAINLPFALVSRG